MTGPKEKTELSAEPVSRDFIRRIVDEDVRTGRNGGKVITRFPPEPNGFLHIGHAKSICLNFGIAEEFRSVCHLRFDDTDPTKEDMTYENSIQKDIRWLGFDWQGKLFHASDYFQQMYEYAIQLIKDGKAYVCALSEEEIRAYRGTVTAPGRISPHASRTIEENLDLFTRMHAGEFADSAYVLRARIDMASPNMKMRDPLLYRIRHAHHYKAGDAWCIYPMYDYAHPISDAIEGITHSICTLEFENNRELYDWILDNVKASFPSRPRQYEFARLDLNYTVMSKRKLLQLVENNLVGGWDDPRLPTISGFRRRGCTPESIRKFCELVGVAKANSSVDVSLLEFCLRDDLNAKAPRVMAVLRPLKVVVDNYPEGQVEELDAAYWPHDIGKEGSRKVPFTREIYIEKDDFMEVPPKDFYRLAPGREVRLRYGYCITCTSVEKDPVSGEATVLHCTYDPETRGGEAPKGRKVKGTIHWVSSKAIVSEVRLYEHLLLDEGLEPDADFLKSLNPQSLEVLSDCRLEPSLAEALPEERFQFERQGYFFVDPVDSKPGRPVFNRIVSLKDSWVKKSAEPVAAPVPEPAVKKAANAPQPAVLSELSAEQRGLVERYMQAFALPEVDAHLLVQDSQVAAFFEDTVKAYDNPQGIAKWINNDVLREIKNRPLSELPFKAAELAELVSLLDRGVISGKTAKDVFAIMASKGGNPGDIVERDHLQQITDPQQLAPIIDRLVAAHADAVSQYKSGNARLFGFFVGLVIKETQGKANAEMVNRLLAEKLKEA